MRDFRQFTYKKPQPPSREPLRFLKILIAWWQSFGLRRWKRVVIAAVSILTIVTTWNILHSEDVPPASVMIEGGSLEDSEDTESGDSLEDTTLSFQDSVPVAESSGSALSPHVRSQRDTALASRIDLLLRRYRPMDAFILAVDGATGEILAWGQRSDSAIRAEPGFLDRATFPAASLIKMVTAASALESGKFVPQTPIPLIGRKHTLYKSQIKPPTNYSGPTITLEDAFAESVNSAFAITGYQLGAHTLAKTAHRLGFSRDYPQQIPQRSSYNPPDTGYGLAEVASGFTQANTLSPLHAAAMVRACLVGGPMVFPWSTSLPGYAPSKAEGIDDSGLSARTRDGMRELMIATVGSGTARKWIRKTVYSYNREALDIGGKTGSLDGESPKGRYDWFAGYAQYKQDPSQFVVLVVMQVHGKLRTLPSTGIAGDLINHWAKHNIIGK